MSFLQEEEEYETKGGRRRTWDDDFVLKRQFSALVPAFDPRPGRTNVQQTTDLEIPPPGQPLLVCTAVSASVQSVSFESSSFIGLLVVVRNSSL